MKHLAVLVIPLLVVGAVVLPKPAHALLGLPSLGNLLTPILQTVQTPPSGTLPSVVGSILPSNDPDALDIDAILDGVIPPIQKETVLTDAISLVLDSPNGSIIPVQIDGIGGESKEGVQITAGGGGVPVVAIHTFDDVRDWSNFDRAGVWIFASAPVAEGMVKLVLGADSDADVLVRSFNLPRMQPNQWNYVSFDLLSHEDEPLPVGSYGIELAADRAMTLKLLPIELGPGRLHHFKLENVLDRGYGFVRVIAEDKFGNVLDHGPNVYDGAKKLVFMDSAPIDLDLGQAGKMRVDLDFNKGISDVVQIDGELLSLGTDLEVTDGKVSSDFGDFTYNLFGATGGEAPGTVSSPAHSVITAAPDPAIVNRPVLITVQARTLEGAPRTEGGDDVRLTISLGNSTVSIPAFDNGDGTYEVVNTPSSPGQMRISGTMNGDAIEEDMDGEGDDGVYWLSAFSEGTNPPPDDEDDDTSGGGGKKGKKPVYGTGAITATIGGTCTPYLTKYIKRGENNDPVEVRKLQEFLRGEGMTQVQVTGVYDLTTFEAVKVFQGNHVKTILAPWQTAMPTGYVYVTTLRTINTIYCEKHGMTAATTLPSVIGCGAFTTPLRSGSSGGEVSKVQQFLVNKSYMATPSAWGFYGPLTQAAVKKFQSAFSSEILAPAGLTTPSGLWLALTMKKANALSCQ